MGLLLLLVSLRAGLLLPPISRPGGECRGIDAGDGGLLFGFGCDTGCHLLATSRDAAHIEDEDGSEMISHLSATDSIVLPLPSRGGGARELDEPPTVSLMRFKAACDSQTTRSTSFTMPDT